jgi:hypothetical protein
MQPTLHVHFERSHKIIEIREVLMCRIFNTIAVTTAVAATLGAAATRGPSIEGVWRTTEVRVGGPATRTITPRMPSLAIITSKHYSRLEIHADGPRPVLTDAARATADELRRAWGPVVAEAGRYETSGSVFTTRPEVAKNPATMTPGSFTSYNYRLEGDTLWLTMQRTERGPVPEPVTVKLARVE